MSNMQCPILEYIVSVDPQCPADLLAAFYTGQSDQCFLTSWTADHSQLSAPV